MDENKKEIEEQEIPLKDLLNIEDVQDPADEAEAPQQPEKRTGFVVDLFDWAEALVYALSLLVLICAFFVRLSGVVGSSMYPTLHNGDQLMLTSIGYDEPERGDIVVLMSDSFGDKPLVKRVIGIGGDIINIDQNTNTVSVNGENLYEPYISPLNGEDMYRGDIGYPYTVPEGQVFVMGDNRNASADSRKQVEVGTIPYEKIVGKAIFRIFPFNRLGRVE